MKAECDKGNKGFEQNLNVKIDHGILFQNMEYPIMNANDHISGENIVTFGRCKSLHNPGGLAAAGVLGGLLGPVVGTAVFAIGKAAIGCKCEPMTLVPWINVDEDYFIDGAPALTIESTLPCYYGGTIKITFKMDESSSDNSDTDESNEGEEGQQEREDKKKQLPSEVQEQIDAYCDAEATDIKATGSEVLAAEQAEKEAATIALQEKYTELFQSFHEFESVDFNQNLPYDFTTFQIAPVQPQYTVPEEFLTPLNINYIKGE